MKKLLHSFFSLILLFVFAFGVTAAVWAAPYGEGSYGEGVYNVGEVPPTSQNNSGNSGSSGSSAPDDGVCRNEKPSSTPDLFQINAQGTSLKLFFSPVTNNRDRYYVSYGTQAGSPQYGFEFENSENGVISVDVQSLQANTVYYFTVRAGNGCMPGDWSNELAVRTGQRTPSYRWSSLPRIVSSAVTRTVNPSSVKKVEIDGSKATPAPTPAAAGQQPTGTPAPSAPEQPAAQPSGEDAQTSSPSFFGKIGNFFKGLLGR